MNFDVKACGARIRELCMKNGLPRDTLAEDVNTMDAFLGWIENIMRGGLIQLLNIIDSTYVPVVSQEKLVSWRYIVGDL